MTNTQPLFAIIYRNKTYFAISHLGAFLLNCFLWLYGLGLIATVSYEILSGHFHFEYNNIILWSGFFLAGMLTLPKTHALLNRAFNQNWHSIAYLMLSSSMPFIAILMMVIVDLTPSF